MAGKNRGPLLLAVAAFALFGTPPIAQADHIAQRRSATDSGWQRVSADAYDRGFRDGVTRGERDAQRGSEFDMNRDAGYRNGDRGYAPRYGSRQAYRDAYRSGFESGYRRGYDRLRVVFAGQGGRNNGRGVAPRGARGYQEPAYARGYSDGFEKGLEDGRDRDRYDPVRHGDYRAADQGYSSSYGSKDAYRNNYRAGFRQGYEDGYRAGTRGRN